MNRTNEARCGVVWCYKLANLKDPIKLIKNQPPKCPAFDDDAAGGFCLVPFPRLGGGVLFSVRV